MARSLRVLVDGGGGMKRPGNIGVELWCGARVRGGPACNSWLLWGGEGWIVTKVLDLGMGRCSNQRRSWAHPVPLGQQGDRMSSYRYVVYLWRRRLIVCDVRAGGLLAYMPFLKTYASRKGLYDALALTDRKLLYDTACLPCVHAFLWLAG